MDKAAEVALKTVKEFLEEEDELEEVIFVLFTKSSLEVYKRKAQEIFV